MTTIILQTQVFVAMGKSDEIIEFYDIRGIAAELRNNTQNALVVTPCQVSLTRASVKFGMRSKQMKNTQILLTRELTRMYPQSSN